MTAANKYPGFTYSAFELLKYISVVKDFTIIMKNGDIVKFTPSDEQAFLKWLDENNVQNIRNEESWIVE